MPTGITMTRTASNNTSYLRTDTGTLTAQELAGGAMYYYLYDGPGSVVNLVNATGGVAATYAYVAAVADAISLWSTIRGLQRQAVPAEGCWSGQWSDDSTLELA
jgi:hypothetical protein